MERRAFLIGPAAAMGDAKANSFASANGNIAYRLGRTLTFDQ